MDKYILNESGEPVRCDDVLTWGKVYEAQRDLRIVGSDAVGDDIRVSTVFLGLDHRFGAPGEPVLWETMIFGGEHDGYCDRYTSREAAVNGHAAALAMVRTTLGMKEA